MSSSERFSSENLSPDKQHDVIAFGYKKHSGKDAAGDYLVEGDYEKKAFAAPIKEGIGKGVFGFDDEQCYGDDKGVPDDFWDVSPGRIFQIVGTDLFRKGLQEHFPEKFNGQIWARAVCRDMIEKQKRGEIGKYVFTDVRFPDEARFLRQHFNTTIVHVECPDDLRQERSGEDDRSDSHDSEKALDGYEKWDFVIDNSGSLTDLYLSVQVLDKIACSGKSYDGPLAPTLFDYSNQLAFEPHART
jgi:hypothetical protein